MVYQTKELMAEGREYYYYTNRFIHLHYYILVDWLLYIMSYDSARFIYILLLCALCVYYTIDKIYPTQKHLCEKSRLDMSNISNELVYNFR